MLPFIRFALNMPLHSNRIVTQTEVVARDSGISVIGITMLFVGQVWKTLGFWTTKVVGHFKWGLKGYPSRT